MTTPRVTEVRLQLEPVAVDTFVDDLEETARRNSGAPPRRAEAAGEALRRED